MRSKVLKTAARCLWGKIGAKISPFLPSYMTLTYTINMYTLLFSCLGYPEEAKGDKSLIS